MSFLAQRVLLYCIARVFMVTIYRYTHLGQCPAKSPFWVDRNTRLVISMSSLAAAERDQLRANRRDYAQCIPRPRSQPIVRSISRTNASFHADPREIACKFFPGLTHTAFGLLVFQLKVMHKFTTFTLYAHQIRCQLWKWLFHWFMNYSHSKKAF